MDNIKLVFDLASSLHQEMMIAIRIDSDTWYRAMDLLVGAKGFIETYGFTPNNTPAEIEWNRKLIANLNLRIDELEIMGDKALAEEQKVKRSK